ALHGLNRGFHAQVYAFHVYPKEPLEIFFRGVFKTANIRNACAVHQNIDSSLGGDSAEFPARGFAVRHIASDYDRDGAAVFFDLVCRCFGLLPLKIHQIHFRAAHREPPGDCLPYAAAGSCHNRRLAVQPETLLQKNLPFRSYAAHVSTTAFQAATVWFLSSPIRSIFATICSPGFSQRFGVRPSPTPAGVPVLIMSPGSRVITEARCAIRSGSLKIRCRVFECCSTSPLMDS